MRKIMAAFISFIVILLILGITLSFSEKASQEKIREEQLIAINEIDQLYQSGNDEEALQKSRELRHNMSTYTDRNVVKYWVFVSVFCLFLIGVYVYSYFRIMRPFNKLNAFAEQISQGNFDTNLEYSRADYFGEFTWAFDNMRTEIVKARKSEKEAIENNKTVIASLSHDLKTPVASLLAYTEALEANMDLTPDKREIFLNVIKRKCDEIIRLTNDMTMHSLTELDRLTICSETLDLCRITRDTIRDLVIEKEDKSAVRFNMPEHPINICADSKRIEQIIENIVNNSAKYAGPPLDVTITETSEVKLEIRDYGPGIPNEDLPFIFDKFYRGHNKEDKPGSGLGLFIVKYLVEKQGGTVTISNSNPGVNVSVIFEKASPAPDPA